jgi:hypothetical protein
VLLLLAVILLRPGGPTLSDDTEHVQRSTVLPFLAAGQTVQQTFTSGDDGLTQVMVRFAVGDGVTGCSVEAEVRNEARVLGHRSARCDALEQAELWTIGFDPVEGSAGQDLVLEVQLHGTSSGPMSLWGGPSLGTLPPAEIDGQAIESSVELHTSYGDDALAAQQIPTALDRIDGYGPFWHHPVAVVLMVVAALGLVVALARAPRRTGLALVIAFAVVKGLLWSTVLPPLEGPDEHAHFAYAQFMGEQHRIPRSGKDQLGIHRTYSEELQVGLRDVFHTTSQWPGNRADFSEVGRRHAEEVLRGASVDAGGNGAAAGYSPYYYVPAAALYLAAPNDLDDQVAAMRLWSVCLGAVGAWLSLLIGRRLFPRCEPAALGLGMAVAAQPMLSQQTAVINNDALVIVAGFACLLVALDLAMPSAHRRLLVLGGLAAGIALATKPFGIAWAPVLAVAWLAGHLRTPVADRRPWLADVGRAAVGAAATYGMWVLAQVTLHLPSTAVQTFNPEPGPKTLERFWPLHTLDSYAALRDRWIDQFWGSFGGLTLPLPGWALGLLTIAAVLTLGGTVAWVVLRGMALVRTRGRGMTPSELTGDLHLALCAFAVVTTLAVLHAADFLQFRHNGRLELLQGRYALMVLPAALALPALLLRRLVPKLQAAAVMAAIAGGIVVLNAISLTLIVERYYL